MAMHYDPRVGAWVGSSIEDDPILMDRIRQGAQSSAIDRFVPDTGGFGLGSGFGEFPENTPAVRSYYDLPRGRDIALGTGLPPPPASVMDRAGRPTAFPPGQRPVTPFDSEPLPSFGAAAAPQPTWMDRAAELDAIERDYNARTPADPYGTVTVGGRTFTLRRGESTPSVREAAGLAPPPTSVMDAAARPAPMVGPRPVTPFDSEDLPSFGEPALSRIPGDDIALAARRRAARGAGGGEASFIEGTPEQQFELEMEGLNRNLARAGGRADLARAEAFAKDPFAKERIKGQIDRDTALAMAGLRADAAGTSPGAKDLRARTAQQQLLQATESYQRVRTGLEALPDSPEKKRRLAMLETRFAIEAAPYKAALGLKGDEFQP